MIKFSSVILSGGTGTRLWPMSRADYPKQFLKFQKKTESLFVETLIRTNKLSNSLCNTKTLIIGNEEHRFIIKNQLKNQNNQCSIILEPTQKNTAPALTLAALEIIDTDDQVMVVMPSDHVIKNNNEFKKIFSDAIHHANDNKICLIGITPTFPSEDYGYIKYSSKNEKKSFKKILSFKEKPDKNTAIKFIKSKNFLWNSGIFILKASVWLDIFSSIYSDDYMNLKKSYKQKKIDGLFVRPNKNYFKKVKSASIDYAVMENFKKFNYNFLVGTASFYWNDMGTWRNVYEYENTNVNFNKNTINIDSDANSILTNNKLVVTLGVKNILVVENDNNLLIANKDKINLLKDFKKYISNKNKSIFNKSSISYRPWGYFRIIDEGYGFKVKKIHVFPKSSLSLQSHEHRTEHWIVINGEAKIIKGNKILILKKNESTFIHFNQIHRLINEKDDILEIIEIQSGDYLGEDDIKRYEDNYGR